MEWRDNVFSSVFYDADGNPTSRVEAETKFKVEDASAHEFQIALIARKTIGNLSAYGGIKYTHLTVNYAGSTEVSRTEYDSVLTPSSKTWRLKDYFDYDTTPDGLPFGIFLGADYKLAQNIGTKLEVRFLDESVEKDAFGVSGGLYFNF